MTPSPPTDSSGVLRALSPIARRLETLRHSPSAMRSARDLRAARASVRRHGGQRFAGVESYCMFIGYPRSCHSLVGSVVDAHPDAVVAHEEDALRYIARGVSREGLFDRLLANSARMAEGGRAWSGYSYELPGQGVARSLRVIGDKKGAQTTRRLGVQPELLEQLRATVQLPLRVVLVIRDPRDNIATMAYRSRGSKDTRVRGTDLGLAARRYFWLHETVNATLARLAPEEHVTVHVDDLTRDAEGEMTRVIEFLGLEATEDFLAAARELIREQPNRSRERFRWPAELTNAIEQRMAGDALLARYADTT